MKLLWLLFPLFLFAKEITLEWLSSKPTSTAKDYYIWRYLQQDISANEALLALQQAKNVNRKLFFAYAKKAEAPIRKIAACMKMSAKELLEQDPECAAAGMSNAKLSTLSKKQIRTFLQKTRSFKPPLLAKILLKKDLSDQEFLLLFHLAHPSVRKKLDRTLLPTSIRRLVGHYPFTKVLKRVAFSESYPKLARSFLATPPERVRSHTAFYLALIALKEKRTKQAVQYLQRAADTWYRFDIDKANFWLYRLTKKRVYLKRLLASWGLNIYTILAREECSLPNNYVVYDTQKERLDINMSDPFIWETLLKKRLKKEEFFYKNTLPIYAYLVQKESRYRIHPFILPYQELLKGSSLQRKALIYAIARQESRFIPGSVSRSYALGLMQFMPFLAKATARKLGIENFDLDMMFQPHIALLFAQDHLDYLQARLLHPLLIAYAYNGGIGFTTKKVLPLFQKYDPYLAMELVPYSESRRYGKKVLANYVIYREILGSKISIRRSLESLDQLNRSAGSKR